MNEHTRILFSLVCFLILGASIALTSAKDVILACGSTEAAVDSDKRQWEPDAKFVKSDKSIQAKASSQDPSLLSQVPYMTARIFTSPATYQIPVKGDKRHFVRFHFYPSSYNNLNISNSYFSVMANDVTLESNFSAAITCQALTQAYLVREFSLAPTDTDVLNITFIPSDKYPNAFAFINGIEVIQMPELFDSAVLVGFSDQTADAKTANLQTMFRLNVGGQTIHGTQDSGGLTRTWYDDAPYIFSAGLGVNLEAGPKFKIDYKNMSDASAPADVYKTARSQGPDPQINLKSNLTWTFQVDTNFTYIVRLHFCEFQLTKINQKAFNIFVNNKTAQGDASPADIIAWTGEKGVPTYKDYAVYVDHGSGDEIWLQMTPSTFTKPEYMDSQLNGLEIFKMETVKNLAGPNPEPSPLQATNQVVEKKFDGGNKKLAFLIGSGGGVAAVLAFALCFTLYGRRKKMTGTDSHTTSWLPLYGNSHTTGTKSSSGKSYNGSHLSNLAGGLCRRFSLPEIKSGTKNFDESNVVGVGGFGKVYKGVIDGKTEVAIKRSNPNSEQGINEFETEIELLSRLRHKHLVSLIGYCEEDGEMCLIYDYMSLGTLREHLYNNSHGKDKDKDKDKPQLSWIKRLEIAIGAARGLHYLHTGAKYTIIHRDVKTTNILLDQNWVAKVSDFGLSKTGPNNGHVTTVVKGSFGYLDPEYFRRQQLTEKSDVYSFGVVLFEILCARPALNPNLPKEQVSLGDWALNCKKKGNLGDIIDPQIKGKIDPECLKKFADTAEKCLLDCGLDRPTMGDILWNLEFALQIQESAENGTQPGQNRGIDGPGNLSIGSEQDMSDQSSEDLNNSGVFSQIVNPKGR